MEIVSYCSTSGDERFGCAQAGCKECVEALLYENSGLAWTMIARQLSGNAEYADLHNIMVAPHGIFDGLFGLAAHVHLSASIGYHSISFEYPYGQTDWWYEIVEGLPNPTVKNGFIAVWNKPGLGVTFNVNAAKARLSPEDRAFFD